MTSGEVDPLLRRAFDRSLKCTTALSAALGMGLFGYDMVRCSCCRDG